MRKFKKDIEFIDLFAGIGGFRIALEEYGAKCVFSSEIDKHACKTYKENFGVMPHGDIKEIDERSIPRHDILCGGFPCQAFSISGKQKGFEDSRGTLFYDIIRIAKYHKPSILFLENVSNLRKHSDGETIKRMKEILIDIGYDVNLEVLNASEYGVPQSRKRLYFVCFRKDLNIDSFKFPLPTYADIALEDVLLSDEETKDYLIIRDDITIKDLKVDKRQLKPIRIGTINKGGQGERIYSPKGHAITLSAYGGGAGAKTGAYLVNDKVRKLSPKECLMVQGFPIEFKIPVTDGQAWKQFGNSVPVPVLVQILAQIIELPQLNNLIENNDVRNRVV